MTKQIVKPILIGILLGAALFVLPFFVLRALVFFLIIGALLRFFAGRQFGWRRYGYAQSFTPALADTIRSMSEEEYRTFRQKFESYSNRHPGESPATENK